VPTCNGLTTGCSAGTSQTNIISWATCSTSGASSAFVAAAALAMSLLAITVSVA
jgi:hypothetical protein